MDAPPPPPPPPPPEPKLVVVVGATGNQGGSVARRFLREPGFRVRGLTRDPGSPAARRLAALGAEMVRADLLRPDGDADGDGDGTVGLRAALRGASLVFSVTDYWEPFFAPSPASATGEVDDADAPGARRARAGRVERAAGRNLADAAAATAATLARGAGLVASTLSGARQGSGGRLAALHHFDAKADVFPRYVREAHPALAAKTCCVQTGFFMSSHRILPDSYMAKLEDGSFEMRFCTDPAAPVPHLDPAADMGAFVYAVHRAGEEGCLPGRAYMAEGTTCTWPAWIAAWSRATGAPARYRQVAHEEMVRDCGGGDFGGEIADMFDYCSSPGYDGGESLVTAKDLREAGIECPMTSLDEWMGRQDWSSVLSKPPTRTP